MPSTKQKGVTMTDENNTMRLASTIASLGSILGGGNKADDLAWKKRMIKAGFNAYDPEWNYPESFNAKTGNEQIKILDKIIKFNLEKDPVKANKILKGENVELAENNQ